MNSGSIPIKVQKQPKAEVTPTKVKDATPQSFYGLEMDLLKQLDLVGMVESSHT